VSRLPVFRPRSDFRSRTEGYRLLPFRFMRWGHGEVLVVNDVGEPAFLDRETFQRFVGKRLGRSDPEYRQLKRKHFLLDSDSSVPLELLATKYRTKKSFLDGFTGLHMFVVTLRCDHTCRYCQVSRVSLDRERFDMSEATAARAIDLMFQVPSPRLKVEFQGGEPLLAFHRLRFIVEEIERRNVSEGRDVQFVVATNLAPLEDSMLGFLRDHRILISTSLDGPASIHNANRPRPGRDSYELAVRNIDQARAALGHDQVSAIMTTTLRSLESPREIVDEYVKLGFDSIFLRPISPYGFAVRTGEAWRYESDQFLAFYKTALAHIVELNRRGHDLVEVYAQILLTRILTPFATGYVDLQSPAGAGLAAVAYNYDGDVYASDEARMLAEMGDTSFRLGNVHRDGYRRIFGGPALQALAESSVLETMPGCADCAFLPYCGADPIFHHTTQGDVVGHRPTSAFCARNMEILRHLFEGLRGNDPFIRELFMSWATRVRLPAASEHRDPREAA
jgi:His-Xaa-Ser system radical SAM maturase HxsB